MLKHLQYLTNKRSLVTYPWNHSSQVRQVFIKTPSVVILKEIGISFILELTDRLHPIKPVNKRINAKSAYNYPV